MKRPKVLVVGINPWVDNTGINTLINFFKEWGPNEVAHIYTREGLPNTIVCNTFYQISENRLFKGLINNKFDVGQRVYNTAPTNKVLTEGVNRISLYRRLGNVAATAREICWKLGRWKEDALCQFLDDFSPDVLFCPTYSVAYMGRLQNFIADYTGCPVILYASDDNYSYKSIRKTPLSLFNRALVRQQLKRLFRRAAKIMVIAPKVKEEYDRLFAADSIVMTKGIDYSKFPYKEKRVDLPIRIVYTGKLIYGRWKSLAMLSAAVERINSEGNDVVFEIYTTDNLSARQFKALSHKGTKIKDAVPQNAVQGILENADIVVFAESLDSRYKNLARLSLSTKVTDYLCSGRCIFAIGDTDIAPIDYFRRNKSAVIATNYSEIEPRLKELIRNSPMITAYGKAAYECGKRNHNDELQHSILYRTIDEALKME